MSIEDAGKPIENGMAHYSQARTRVKTGAPRGAARLHPSPLQMLTYSYSGWDWPTFLVPCLAAAVGGLVFSSAS